MSLLLILSIILISIGLLWVVLTYLIYDHPDDFLTGAVIGVVFIILGFVFNFYATHKTSNIRETKPNPKFYRITYSNGDVGTIKCKSFELVKSPNTYCICDSLEYYYIRHQEQIK